MPDPTPHPRRAGGRRDLTVARRRGRRLLGTGAAGLAILALGATGTATATPPAGQDPAAAHRFDGLGITPGKVKHVWVIMLENKSYDATFTGLNDNTYLWKTLPSQGVLLRQYYGTSHFSQGNYTSMVSGQGTNFDLNVDCPNYDAISGTIDTSGTPATNPDYGQIRNTAGPNAAPGQNGCVYPSTVPTLFNQLDSAGVSWKGYAQDLDNPDASGPAHSQGPDYCGAPYKTPGATGSTAQPNPGSANATDQYVPKHFPFPWFSSIRDAGDCDAQHIADVFDASNGLYHDLQHASTTPALSYITPNNCSDAHDAVCRGNNLSGGFSDPDTPKPPVNYTGGLYASDLFLEHVIPEIEASPAFKDGGLIDITFDEANPPFTYTGNSFANSTSKPANFLTALESSAAGETLFGDTANTEPTGPNTPLAQDASGNQLYPGPGYNAFIDRPASCVAQTVPPQPAGTCLQGGAGHPPGPRLDNGATAPAGASTVSDNSAVITDRGRTVSGTGIPAGAFVGAVTNTGVTATAPAQSGGIAVTGAFRLVDAGGQPLATTGPVSGVTLGGETPQTDPLFTATGATPGGGDVGAVLISPYIRPGTTSDVAYNHYSWLRTVEDLYGVGATAPGVDGRGHLGFAAQPGLAPFGRDVFNAPGGNQGPGNDAGRLRR